MNASEFLECGPLSPAQKRLVSENTGIALKAVRDFLRAYSWHSYCEDDLVASAYEALCRAARMFDPTKAAFSTYAYTWCKTYITRTATRTHSAIESTHAVPGFKYQPHARGEMPPESATHAPDPERSVAGARAYQEVRRRLMKKRTPVQADAFLEAHTGGVGAKSDTAKKLGCSKQLARWRYSRVLKEFEAIAADMRKEVVP